MIEGLRPYPEVQDSGVPWLREVPAHWDVRRLKQTFSRIVGGSTPSSTEPAFWDGELVWITPADISRNARVKDSQRRITHDGLRSCSSELVPQGSLIVTSRAPVGNVAIAETDLCTNQGCKALVVNPTVVDSAFGLHVLTTLKEVFQSLAVGTTFAEISTSRIGTVSFPLPPLSEQAAIVRFLNHVDRRIQRYIRAKQKLIKLLEEQKQAIIHQAVTRGLDPNVRLKPSGVDWLGDVPEHWSTLRLKTLLRDRITDGPHVTPQFVDAGVPFLSVDGIQNGDLTFDGCRYVSESDHREFRKKALPKRGDILLGKAASTGKIAQVKVDFEFSIWSPLALIRLDAAKCIPTFVELYLKSPTAQTQIEVLCTMNTQRNISMQDIPEIVVPVPPLAEQRLIVAAIASDTEGLIGAAERAEREIHLLCEFRTRLVADVVTGKLDVREAAANLPDAVDEHELLDDADTEQDVEEVIDDDIDVAAEEVEA